MYNPTIEGEGGEFKEEVSYEPVNIEPRFSDPKSTIDPDKTKNWFGECYLFSWVISGL